MNRIEIDTKSNECKIEIDGIDVSDKITGINLQFRGGEVPIFEMTNKPNSIIVPKLEFNDEYWTTEKILDEILKQ